MWYQSIQNFTGNVPSKKNFEKTLNNVCKTRTGGQFFAKSRDLVITVRLAQFLTDRARSTTNRFRIFRGVPNKKMLKNLCAFYRSGSEYYQSIQNFTGSVPNKKYWENTKQNLQNTHRLSILCKIAWFSYYRQTRSILNWSSSEWHQSIQNFPGSVPNKKNLKNLRVFAKHAQVVNS